MTTTNGKLPLPLKGIRILDATHIVAGPFCSLILADMGAEVIKIERPRTGDLSRGRGPFLEAEDGRKISARYLGINRNKKSVTLDLRNPQCKSAFENLVLNSDVLVDNWGPGAFQRLGLGYEHLKEINPRLVYASITGYGDSDGRRGPYSAWPANNLSIQGMAGWMEVTGDPDSGPQAVGDNMGDSIPGLWTALGIVLALRTRDQTGRGQLLDMSMYDCMVSHMVSSVNVYQATGKNPTRSHARLVTAGMAFKARDGYVLMAGVRSSERLRAMWQLLGRNDLADDPRYLGLDPDGDFYFSQVIPAIEQWSQTLSKWEVVEQLTQVGFSMGVAQTISDLDHCPQLEARQMFVETDDTLGGRFKSLQTPIRLTNSEDSGAATPPLLGENNLEILCGIGGLSPEQLDQLEQQGAV
jgi:crotonobetainyl-CoA:carnitine CoA-transferase CaiB-like acyl-CoA transferase